VLRFFSFLVGVKYTTEFTPYSAAFPPGGLRHLGQVG